MTIYDISMTLSENMLKYPSLRAIRHVFEKEYSRGDGFALSSLEMQMHLGTHLDAPYHYVDGGARIDQISPEIFWGRAAVVELDHTEVSTQDAARVPSGCKRVLFKTPHSQAIHSQDADAEPSYIAAAAAELLAGLGISLVGIDSFSVDRPKTSKAAHLTLLGAGTILLEGIDLSQVPEGQYTLCCAPLKIDRAEAGPCRALLRSDADGMEEK